MGWLLKTPTAWPWAAVPFLVAIALVGGLGALTYVYVPGLVAARWGGDDAWYAAAGLFFVQVVAVLSGWIASVLVGLGLAQPLSGPALERLVRDQERALGLPARAPTRLLVDVWRSLQSLLVGYAWGLPSLALLFVLSLAVPAAAPVLVPLKLAVTAAMVAWDFCDYPLSVRGVPVGARVTILRQHFRALLGFGLGLALASLVPLLLFALLPVGVVGATRLVHEFTAYEPGAGDENV